MDLESWRNKMRCQEKAEMVGIAANFMEVSILQPQPGFTHLDVYPILWLSAVVQF